MINDWMEPFLRADRQRKLELDLFLEHQNIRRALGPFLWLSLRRKIEADCQEISEAPSLVRLVCELDKRDDRLTVHNKDNSRKSTIEYAELCPCIIVAPFGETMSPILFKVDMGNPPDIILIFKGEYDAFRHKIIEAFLKPLVVQS